VPRRQAVRQEAPGRVNVCFSRVQRPGWVELRPSHRQAACVQARRSLIGQERSYGAVTDSGRSMALSPQGRHTGPQTDHSHALAFRVLLRAALGARVYGEASAREHADLPRSGMVA
jgi:hypothetical protein